MQGNVYDDHGHVDSIPMNKTVNDVFLSKLCPKVQSVPSIPPHEDDYFRIDDNEGIVEEVATYNENVNWKKQKPVLGMRFESPKQLKHMF